MSLPVTDRTRLRRLPDRGRHELAEVAAVLDEALYCHVGITTDDGPVVIPTIHARVGDQVIVHGSPEQCRATIQRYFDNGVTTSSLAIMPFDPELKHWDAVRLLAPTA